MPYHVTKQNIGREIWKSGNIKPKNVNRPRRRKMREHIDRIGNKFHNKWVNRQEAVFAWSSFERARRYSRRYRKPAIVEFDVDGVVWSVRSETTEIVYKNYSHSNTDDDTIQWLVNESEEWSGISSSTIELWMRPQTVNQIYRVLDESGDTLDI